MAVVPANINIHTADAEHVQLRFDGADLILNYIDWREQPQERVFRDVLGFRWDGEFDEGEIRDDTVYEVVESAWLERQANLQLRSPAEFAHYKLCFNASGVLDVLCRRIA